MNVTLRAIFLFKYKSNADKGFKGLRFLSAC